MRQRDRIKRVNERKRKHWRKLARRRALRKHRLLHVADEAKAEARAAAAAVDKTTSLLAAATRGPIRTIRRVLSRKGRTVKRNERRGS